MAMLTKLFIVWAAVAMFATALVVSPNVTSRSTRYLHKRAPPPQSFDAYFPNLLRKNEYDGRPENTYTAQQTDQYQQGHMEALRLCRRVVDASTHDAVRFNRIFREYFPPTDRQLVLNVFKSILGPGGKGNPKFVDIDLVDDFPPEPTVEPEEDWGPDQHCKNQKGIHAAVTVPKGRKPSDRTQLILCPEFFTYGTIEGGKGQKWPGADDRKCNNIGDRVSNYMLTLGSSLLHEYTHAPELVRPPLRKGTDDKAYLFYAARGIKNTDLATDNADNYSLFAIELEWTFWCRRDYAPPVEDNSPRLPATGAQGQSSRHGVQKALSLHKRTPMPRNYGVRTPNTEREHDGNKENTFSAQEIEQFQAGHNDALMMCSTVIEQATKNPKRFDRIFREYFPFSERQLIIGVFKAILDADGQGKGNPKFEDIDVVDDYPQPQNKQDFWCAKGDAAAWTLPVSADRAKHRRQMIMCPSFWKFGTFKGGAHREWPNVPTRKCSNIAYRVSRNMETLGEVLLHEYMHIDELVQPPLTGTVGDLEYNFYDCRELALTQPGKTKYNADSYAKFATELTWSTMCDRDFKEPFEGNGLDGNAKRQTPRDEIQLATSLQKRTAFSQPYEHPIPMTEHNTYTVEQMDQYLEAHIDALHMCSVIIEQAERNTDRFNRIFPLYFKPDDREIVVDVFKAILDYDDAKQGSPHFSNMNLVDDHVRGSGTDRKWVCEMITAAATAEYLQHTDLILCPFFFKFGTIEKTSEDGRRGHLRQIKCEDLGKHVNAIMEVMPQTLLHEYTHVKQIMEPIIGAGLIEVGKTLNHAYGFEKSRGLDKNLATRNADSYANFATEMFWTTKCDRDFKKPKPAEGREDNRILREYLIALGVRPEKGLIQAAAGVSLVDALFTMGLLVEPPPIPDDDSCEEEGSVVIGDSGAEAYSGGEEDSAAKGNSAAKKEVAVGPVIGNREAGDEETDAKETDTTETDTKETDTKQQRSRQDIQSVLALQKRTAFSQPYEYPIPNTNVDNTYTVQQMDQFLQGHLDALLICLVVIEQAACNDERFDRIFREYFKPEDRTPVLDVFKAILDYDGEKQGSPKLSVMNIIDDFKPTPDSIPTPDPSKDRHCDPGNVATTRTRTSKHPSQLILCPPFFVGGGTINGGLGREWPGFDHPVTCDTIGTRPSHAMVTTGHILLHEYTHAPEIMEPVWRRGKKKKLVLTNDHAYGFDSCRKLDKKLANKNAESYAAFASELFWSTLCNKDFDPPVPEDGLPTDQVVVETLAGLDIDPPEEEDPSGQGDSGTKGDSTAKGGTAAKRDLAANELHL